MKMLLKSMLQELNEYRRCREDLLTMYVSERLAESFNQYDKELQQSIEFLAQKHEKSLIKRMKKLEDGSKPH